MLSLVIIVDKAIVVVAIDDCLSKGMLALCPMLELKHEERREKFGCGEISLRVEKL